MKKKDLEKAIEEFKKLKLVKEQLEAKMEPLKALLSAEVEKAPDLRLVVGVHKVMLHQQTRGFVNLEEARKKYGKKLPKFITEKTFNVMRVS